MKELPILPDRCEHLRWKGMFIDTNPTMPDYDSVLWCHTTQTCLGPDGQVVDKWECNPARPCYKAL